MTDNKDQTSDNVILRATEREFEWAADVMSSTEPWISLGRKRDQCLTVMRNPAHLLFVAHGAGNEPLGFILLHPEGLAASPYVRSLAVAPAARGTGVGTELLRFAEQLFTGKSRHLFLCVSSFNLRAQALYERLGYAKVG
ncbi:MAG TPA: GNAT family N-acetyltransferase, partial [Alphaproteobacteria bacterium]|nr:GNAT family N-acetyltransferase [Alphaproteobacteria bacterium]